MQQGSARPLTVAVTGASGLIGRALVAALRERGDEVVTLVRREPASAGERRWDPATGHLDPQALAGVDAVVNLAGPGVGDKRWTPAYKARVLRDRVSATEAVAEAVAARLASDDRAIHLVNASAVGYYGDRGEELLTEDSPGGLGFLAEVCRAWEGATQAASAAGAPVTLARTGLVMSGAGGALAPLVRATRLGAGGPMGSGRQFWPVISRRDEIAALLFLLDHPDLTGPVNLVGVEPPRQREVAGALGRLLHRPAILPAPGAALRAVIGEFAGEIMASQRVLPDRLLAAGFVHQDRALTAVLASALAEE